MTKLPRYSRVLDAVPAAYFDEARQAFAQAAAQSGTRDVFTRVGGMVVRFQFAGQTLAPLIFPAFAFGESKDAAPRAHLTVHCWDNAETGGHLPLPTSGLILGVRNDCLALATNERYRAFYHDWMHVLSCIDLPSREAFYCVLDAARLPVCEQATPMKHLLNAIFNLGDMQLIHGAAVGTAKGSLVFAGPGGAGKSTTALACVKHGLLYQGDDLCAVSAGDPPMSFSIYNSAKLRANAVHRFPLWRNLFTDFEEFGEEKSYLHFPARFPEKILPQAPILALVLPVISNEPSSRLERATPLEAMKSVIPWTKRIVPTTEKHGERILLRIISRVPAYHLHLGADEEQTVNLLRGLLENPGCA